MKKKCTFVLFLHYKLSSTCNLKVECDVKKCLFHTIERSLKKNNRTKIYS